MNLVESVFNISEKFMANPSYVNINNEKLTQLSNMMLLSNPMEFPKKSNDTSDQFKTCLLEFIGNSINYCYWYGSAFIRPEDSSSTKMYNLLKESFKDYVNFDNSLFRDCIDTFIECLSLGRFPLLEERVRHLNELKNEGESFIKYIIESDKTNLDKSLKLMVSIFPGYASDIFLKRAFLFFAQLYREFGWFEKDMYNLPVPADYQISKMLEHYKVLEYDDELKESIEDERYIPKGCKAECEIRAAAIIACKKLCQKTGWTMPHIDGNLWLQRHRVTNPFHLTVTSDY